MHTPDELETEAVIRHAVPHRRQQHNGHSGHATVTVFSTATFLLVYASSRCHCQTLSLAPVNPDWFYLPGFYLSGTCSPGCSPTNSRRAVKRLCACVCVCVCMLLKWDWRCLCCCFSPSGDHTTTVTNGFNFQHAVSH